MHPEYWFYFAKPYRIPRIRHNMPRQATGGQLSAVPRRCPQERNAPPYADAEKKNTLSNASARSSTVKLAMLSYPSRRKRNIPTCCGGTETSTLSLYFGNGKPDGASFFLFHGARCSLCFSGTQGRNGIPTGPLPIHLNSQSTYNDIKRRWGKGSRCDSV